MMPAAQTGVQLSAILGWILLLWIAAWSLREIRSPDAMGSAGWKWWALAAATVLCFRWPLLGIAHQLNPDESQLIAGALTLRHDPVFWRSVDGGTAGPLDYYPLLPAAWGGGFASYAVARLIGLAVAFGAIVLGGETLACLGSAAWARIAVLPALAALAFTTDPEFLHYSTELMPALLVAGAVYAAARQDRAPARHWPWLAGLLLGSVAWAKLQAVPIAAVIWLLVAAHECRSGRSRSLVALISGALLPAVACFGAALLTGQMENLIVPYISNNLAYVDAPQYSWAGVAAAQWQNALSDGYLGLWLAGAILFVVPGFLCSSPGRRRQLALAAAGLFAVGVLGALAPRRPSGHHLQLIPLPLLWLTGTVLAMSGQRESVRSMGRRRYLVAGLFLVCTLLPQLAWRAAGIDPFSRLNAAGVSAARLELSALVRRFCAPGEPLAIWGWRCSLYVEASRPQATRQAQAEAQIYPRPLQPYFLRRYLEDFQAANPPVFADAVGPGNFAFENRDRAHESFPPLRAWVRDRYTLIADLDGTRVFIRNDRLAAVNATLPAPARP